jgi:hypothetical protein
VPKAQNPLIFQKHLILYDLFNRSENQRQTGLSAL